MSLASVGTELVSTSLPSHFYSIFINGCRGSVSLFFNFHDYLHCRVSLKASKLRAHMELSSKQKKCEIIIRKIIQNSHLWLLLRTLLVFSSWGTEHWLSLLPLLSFMQFISSKIISIGFRSIQHHHTSCFMVWTMHGEICPPSTSLLKGVIGSKTDNCQ